MSSACNEMFSDRLLTHFRNPAHVGILPPPACAVTVENPVCGDVLQLSARVDAERIVAVGFQVRGCTAAIAAGSAVATLLQGLSTAEAARIDAAAVEAELGGLPATSMHAARLAADGVAALLRSLPAG